MTVTPVQRALDTLTSALGSASVMDTQVACLRAFAELVMDLPTLSDADWQAAPATSRSEWHGAMSQLQGATEFLLAGVAPEPEAVELGDRLMAARRERERLRDRRDTQLRELGALESDIDTLREQLSLLEALVPLAALRQVLSDDMSALRAHQAANQRLAGRAREHRAELERLGVLIGDAELSREAILRDDLMLAEEVWAKAKEALR